MDDVIQSDLDCRGFSLRTAYYLAHASNSAYYELGDWVQRLGLGRDTRVFSHGQFRGFLGTMTVSRLGLLAFRGTENTGNLLTDLQTPLVTHAAYPGRVHYGFAEAVEAVWPRILELLGHPSQAMPLWVTGHSLGGAMATLASVRLAEYGYTVRTVYTYGSPRLGDRLFHDYYRLPNYRLVHDNDLVPHLPFRWCYQHVGELKLLDGDGNLVGERAAWEDKKHLLGGKAKRLQRAGKRPAARRVQDLEFDWLSDHLLESYLAALEKALLRVPSRRRDEEQDHRARPPLRRVDRPLPGIPQPQMTLREDRRLHISEAEFIEAFGRQRAANWNRADAGR